jgi:purine-binding chemotaxis protein CheW
MNLSEIRKKAQQEKAGIAGAVAFVPGNEPAEDAAPAEKPVEPASEALVNFAPKETQPAPLTLPEAPSLQEFDPVAVLMAGRADGMQDAAAQLGKDDDAEYQELLCFRVAAEKYAVNIMEIKEIIKPREVTEVPRVPDFVTGVLSLRGIIIPVFNLHKRLGHAVVQESGKERIIVVKKGDEFCGVLVDEVIQVARLAAAAIEPPPAVLEGIDRDFVNGIGRFDGQMLILLNLGKILDLNLF